MKVLIIEDEPAAQQHLADLLEASMYDVTVSGTAGSVKQAIELIGGSKNIELIFLDIQLSDGLVFEIFKRIPVEIPIIFTTAYDKYLLEAFQVQSIGYLLKPITLKNLEDAIEKNQKMASYYQSGWQNQIEQLLTNKGMATRKRFLVKIGTSFKPIHLEDVAAFFREDLVYLITEDGSRYPIDESLDSLESQIDSSLFIRLNRKTFVRKSFVKNLEQYTGSKLLVSLKINLPFEIIVSQEKATWVKNELGN